MTEGEKLMCAECGGPARPNSQFCGDECFALASRRQVASLVRIPTATPSDEVVEEFLHELDGWERAYPLSVFPEPDMRKAAELLKAGGMTLDAISASNMRHVVSRIAPKARAAIAALSAIEGEKK